LSDEFTTGELVDWTQGASLTLPALQTLEWGNGTTLNLTCPPANGAETATAARRDLSTDELTLSLTRIQYAGALTNSTTGVVYRATMLHLFTPEGASTSAVVYVTNLWAKGTGGAVELWPTNGVTVEPPLAEGVISPNVLMVQLTALSMVLPSPQAALTLGYDRWFSAYEILPASFTADEAWIEIRGTNGVLVYKDDMIDKSGGTHGHNWHGTWNQGSMDGRYVNPSNSPYSVSVVTECYGVTSTSNIKAVDVEAQAFAGRRLFGWSDDHISGIAATLAELSYETEEDQSVSEASAIAAVPDRLVWYTLSHGLVDSNDVFKALDYGDEFFPGDVPTGVDYSLVFLNGCCSAQLGSGSNAEPFKDAFSADAYIGWKTTIHGSIAAGFASEFFAHLDGNKTISQAISDALATYTPGGFSHNQIVSSIRVIGDSDLIVDLSP
jgi:hypothetical protein